jgi:hypothetical protein
VTDDFFDFFGSRMLAGRSFEPADALRGESVAVVDTDFAAAAWPGADPIGQRVGLQNIELQVIGVVEPIRYRQDLVSERHPTLFTLLGQSGAFGATFLVRHEGNAVAIIAAIESRVREADASFDLAMLQPLHARRHLRRLPEACRGTAARVVADSVSGRSSTAPAHGHRQRRRLLG